MKFVTSFLVFGILCMSSLFVQAQSVKTYKEKSDPAATKILKNLKKVYGKYEGIELKYSLELEYGEEKQLQEGEILQEGDKYRINNNGNLFINDGSTVWVYIKEQNEVQVNDYIPEEDDFMFSPAKIFSIGENDKDFVYVITGEDSRGYKIEFKPLDKDSDIMKIRIRVDKSQTKISSVKVFSDDGTRMTFKIKSIKDVSPSSSSFKFNKAKYPGVTEVDMRD